LFGKNYKLATNSGKETGSRRHRLCGVYRRNASWW